jgi:hypothetical protein
MPMSCPAFAIDVHRWWAIERMAAKGADQRTLERQHAGQ